MKDFVHLHVHSEYSLLDGYATTRGIAERAAELGMDSIALTDQDCDAVIDAMRIAAEKRTEGLLGNSRRQHYGHAALLVASCVAFAPGSRASELLRWASDLRQQYWRRHAFREELARASESLGVLVSV